MVMLKESFEQTMANKARTARKHGLLSNNSLWTDNEFEK